MVRACWPAALIQAGTALLGSALATVVGHDRSLKQSSSDCGSAILGYLASECELGKLFSHTDLCGARDREKGKYHDCHSVVITARLKDAASGRLGLWQ